MNKGDFEIKAIVAGASQKEMLDFESVFKQAAGCSMESPMIDDNFLKEKGMEIAVTCRALLSAKLSLDGVNRIVGVFESYCR